MKKIRLLSIMILVLAMFISCARSHKSMSPPMESFDGASMSMDKAPMAKMADSSRMIMEEADYAVETSAENESTSDVDLRQIRKVIRTALLTMYVENFEKSADSIQKLTDEYGGTVANKSFSKQASYVTGTLTIWIPSEKLMQFVNEMGQIGKVSSSNITAEDISDKYYDLEARLNSWKIQEKRLLELLEKPGTTLEELLRLEQELNRVRSEIESMEGRKRMWDKLVAYSTVTINIHQDIQAVQEPDDIFKPLRVAIRDMKPTFLGSVESIVSVVAGLIVLVVALIPWAVVVFLCYFLFKKIFGKSWEKMREKQKADREARLAARQEKKNNAKIKADLTKPEGSSEEQV